jgi:hypothetical protein
VLAKAARRTAGIRGISLFIVPKFLPKEDGERARTAQRHRLRLDRAQDGDQGLVDLRHEFRRRDRLADRRAA